MTPMALKDQLGKMVGPLPMGAWLAIVGGGLAFAYYTSKHSAAPADTALDNTSTDPGVGLGGVPAGYVTDTSGDNTGSNNGIVDNDSWGTAAVNALVARGYPAGPAQTAVSKYLSGGTLNAQENAMINIVIPLIGAPPSLPQTHVGSGTSGGSTTTPATWHGVSGSAAGQPGPLGMYVTRTNVHYYNANGTAVGTRAKNYGVHVFQWGKIGSTWYGKSTTYYYRASDLVRKANTTNTIVPKKSPVKKAPAKPQKPKAPAKPKVRTYTVRKGDSLSSIGQRLGVNWRSIYSANRKKIGSNPNMIHPGLVLTIPAS